MEVGLSRGDFVLDGDPAPPHRKAQQPHQFRNLQAQALAASV